MKNVRVTDTIFEAVFDPQGYFRNAFGFEVSDKTYNVKIHFSAKAAFYILEKSFHKEESKEEKTDGSVILSFPTRRLEEVQRWVMSWGSDAKVLSPKALVNLIHDQAQAMKDLYKEKSKG